MKVAYNGCFGGFSLSPLAETEYREKKGITLTWYEGVGDYPYISYKKASVTPSRRSCFSVVASTKDLGDEIKEVPSDSYFYESWYGDENRSDPDLIEVLERLGEKANGAHASIEIKEVPDGAEFEITEYDGSEDVVPPRQEW